MNRSNKIKGSDKQLEACSMRLEANMCEWQTIKRVAASHMLQATGCLVLMNSLQLEA
jgi:hypothetical protein